jgi:hypothetical protein
MSLLIWVPPETLQSPTVVFLALFRLVSAAEFKMHGHALQSQTNVLQSHYKRRSIQPTG